MPVPPASPSEAITYNSTTASVWFDLWSNGGCDILYYTVEWTASRSAGEWKLSGGKPAAPAERVHTVDGLEPATEYRLKVTARNNIGSSHAVYNFTTLTADGGETAHRVALKTVGTYVCGPRVRAAPVLKHERNKSLERARAPLPL